MRDRQRPGKVGTIGGGVKVGWMKVTTHSGSGPVPLPR